ncbi:MAG: hypothetical protein AAF806_23675 [Bacteroidota bacterium]
MRREHEIPISEQDLKFIVRDEFEETVDLARYNSYCSTCYGKDEVEMIEYTLSLNDLNDVIFRGKCKSCNGKIVRYVEIGELAKFRMRTEIIRESKVNKN